MSKKKLSEAEEAEEIIRRLKGPPKVKSHPGIWIIDPIYNFTHEKKITDALAKCMQEEIDKEVYKQCLNISKKYNIQTY